MKTKQLFLVALALLVSTIAFSQVGIGTLEPHASSILDLESTTKGFLPPRMTDAQRDAIASPAEGLTIFNTTENCLQWHNGSVWYSGCSGAVEPAAPVGETPDPLPANIVLNAISPYFIASVFDTDYLPYTTPTAFAQLPGTPADDDADGTNEAVTIDVLGTLSTTGVTIKIPYTVTVATVALPVFTQTITIPAAFTNNNTATAITFEYAAQTLAVGSGTIDATLKATTATLEAIKLDLNSGLGNDFLGWLLGTFTYALDNAGGTAGFQVRVTPGIPDLNFGDNVHDYIYLPIVSQTGKRWLNNNLGADYANINKAAFNPAQQATAANDWRAYGSLFQWGRVADGHEIIEAWSATAGTAAEGTISVVSPTPIPSHKLFITAGGEWYNGTTPDKKELWLITVKTIYDPCPNGYRVPTPAEFTAERNASNFTPNSLTGGFNSDLKLSGVGRRSGVNGAIISPGISGYYWTSGNVPVIPTSLQHSQHFVMTDGTIQAQMSSQARSTGSGIRCIEE